MENEKLTYINSRGERLELGVDLSLIHILPQIKDAIFSAFVYSTNGGEEKEAADGEADTTAEGNRVAVQDE